MLRMVSSMPGMENFEPERQDTSRGLDREPKLRLLPCSIVEMAWVIWSQRPGGNSSPASKKAQASVVTVNPGGTGTPRRVMSARYAPFPPRSPQTFSQSSPARASACSTSLKR